MGTKHRQDRATARIKFAISCWEKFFFKFGRTAPCSSTLPFTSVLRIPAIISSVIPQTSNELRSNRIIPRGAATSLAPVHLSYKTILHPCIFRLHEPLTSSLNRPVAGFSWSGNLCGNFFLLQSRPPFFRPSCIFAHYFARPPFSRGILFTAEIACKTRNAPPSIFIAACDAEQ